MSKGLWCPSCHSGVFTTSPLALTVDEGIVFQLGSICEARCIRCGGQWLYDNSVHGVHTTIPIRSSEATRLISEARKREWDAHINKKEVEITDDLTEQTLRLPEGNK